MQYGDWGVEWSRDRWRHVIQKGQGRDLVNDRVNLLDDDDDDDVTQLSLGPNISKKAGDRGLVLKDYQ